MFALPVLCVCSEVGAILKGAWIIISSLCEASDKSVIMPWLDAEDKTIKSK